jgi:hypothetical protein
LRLLPIFLHSQSAVSLLVLGKLMFESQKSELVGLRKVNVRISSRLVVVCCRRVAKAYIHIYIYIYIQYLISNNRYAIILIQPATPKCNTTTYMLCVRNVACSAAWGAARDSLELSNNHVQCSHQACTWELQETDWNSQTVTYSAAIRRAQKCVHMHTCTHAHIHAHAHTHI